MAIPSWLHLSQVSGSGDTIITITADTWEGAVQRDAELLISGITKSVTVPVTQLIYDYGQDYTTFNIESGGYITWSRHTSGITKTIEYRINGGSWTSIGSSTAGTRINVSTGDKVEVRGDNETYAYPRMSSQGTHYVYYRCGYFGGTASYSISGNIMSMIQSSGFSNRYTMNQPHALDSMFLSCSALTDAHNLVLPATGLTEECYAQMFQNCSRMVHGPKQLPAEVVPKGAYSLMFLNCSAMTEAPVICATTVYENAFYGMFESCSSLTESPILLPQTLAANCCKEMFMGCSSLSAITCLATSIYGEPPYYYDYGTDEWVDGVAATGVFTKSPNMNDWTVSISGIPPGWTVVDYNS